MQAMSIGESGRIIPTGVPQEVTPERQAHQREEGESALTFARRSGTHLWAVLLTHRATDEMLDAHDGRIDAQPILDADTLLGPPSLGCLVCEINYEPRLRRRRCKGDPRGVRGGILR